MKFVVVGAYLIGWVPVLVVFLMRAVTKGWSREKR